MADLKLDYLSEAKDTIGRIYEAMDDGTTPEAELEDWYQVIAESLVSIAHSLSILAYREYR